MNNQRTPNSRSIVATGTLSFAIAQEMLSNPDTGREYDENLEVSEFSDYESGDESENEGDGLSYNEDWDVPPSETPSDSEDESIPDGMECVICLKGTYRSRRRDDDHFPMWFPCHICRAETRCVGEISQQEDFCDSVVRCEMRGEVMCTIWNWVPVRRWMAKRSKTVAVGLMKRAMRVWCTPSSDNSSDISMSDDTPSIYVEGRLLTQVRFENWYLGPPRVGPFTIETASHDCQTPIPAPIITPDASLSLQGNASTERAVDSPQGWGMSGSWDLSFLDHVGQDCLHKS